MGAVRSGRGACVGVGVLLCLTLAVGSLPAASASSASVTVSATVRSCLAVEVVPIRDGAELVVRTNCQDVTLCWEDASGQACTASVPRGVSRHRVSSSWTLVER